MKWIEVTQKLVVDAHREVEEAERALAEAGILAGTEASRVRYEHALQELDRAQRAYMRAERDEAWHTPGSTLARA
jgi:hypothetical protein